MGAALEMLIAHYFHLPVPSSEGSKSEIASDILEQRTDEKASLESIYEKAFEERLPNRVWAAKLDLPYLLERCKAPQQNSKAHTSDSRNRQQKPNRNSRSKELCNFIASGKPCKYGDKCRFSHQVSTSKESSVAAAQPEDNHFILEIRFPPGSCPKCLFLSVLK